MAINFPSSPSDGQIYTFAGRTWVYRTANGAWSAQVQNTPGFYSQTTAPTGVKEGDEWYDESTGIFYRYIYDGDTYQWVEVGPAAIPFAASDTVAGGIEIAIQEEMEAASSTTLAVTPGRQHYHPSACKAWCRFNGTGTPATAAAYNVASITDRGAGLYTVNFTTSFSSANYAAIPGAAKFDGTDNANQAVALGSTGVTPAAGSCPVTVGVPGTPSDNALVTFAAFGDQ